MPEVTFIGIGAITARGRAAIETAAVQSGEDLVGAQMAAAPVRTGTLRGSIHIEGIESGGDSVTVTTSTGGEADRYAIFVHEGTGAHEIEPSAKQALAWPGGDHPVKRVHHPGTRPDHYMSGPLLANVPVYQRAVAAAAAGEF